MKKDRIAIGLVICAALIVRLYAIRANLPYAYWHDENNYIEMALRLGAGNLAMKMYAHGGLYQLLLLAAYAVYCGVLILTGTIHSPAGLFLSYIKDPSPFFLIARATTVLCGTGIVFLSYRIAKRLYGARVGFGAAVFTGFSLIMVQMSCVALADMLAVFLSLLAFYLLLTVMASKAGVRTFYAAAFITGLSIAAKYYTLFNVVPLVLVAGMTGQGIAEKGERARIAALRMCAGCSVAVLGFFAGMPFFLLNIGGFMQDTVVRMGGEYMVRNPNPMTWLFYFTHHLPNGLGIALAALSLAGVVYAGMRHARNDILVLAIPVTYYLFIMRSMGFAYHLLPAVPFLLILGARLLDVLVKKIRVRGQAAVYAAFCVLFVLPTGMDMVKFVAVAASPDTRSLAKAWIEKAIPQGVAIMAEGYIGTEPVHTVPLDGNRETLERDLRRVSLLGGSGRVTKERMRDFVALYAGKPTYTVYKTDWLDKEAIERVHPLFIVLSSSKDTVIGDELSYYIGEGYHEKRRDLRGFISGRYSLLHSFAPTVDFTPAFPHLMDHDYRALRALPFTALRGFIKGPKIEVYGVADGKR